MATCQVTETPESSCSDGLDNDCDGNIDGADSDCAGGTPTIIAAQEHEGTSSQNLSAFDLGQTFVGTADPLYSISIYVLSAPNPTTIPCRIGTSANLSSVYTEEISIHYTGTTGWLEGMSATNPNLTTGTWYMACGGGSTTQIGREENPASPYANGTYRYGTVSTWNVGQSTANRDLNFRIKVLQ